jgi:hypothetical protein
MTPEDLKRFNSCLSDLDVFIQGFQKQANGPKGAHYKEPLLRLQKIREDVSFLHEGTTNLLKSKAPVSPDDVPRMLSGLERSSQQNFRAIREDLHSLANVAGKIKPNVKRLEGMSSQILSLGQVSLEAAGKLRNLLSETAKDAKVAGGDKQVQEAIRQLEFKINAVGRGVAKIDQTTVKLPLQLDDQGDSFEVNFAAIESKLSGLLERADMGGLLSKLEPRLRNSEDGLKVLLDQIRSLHNAVRETSAQEGVRFILEQQGRLTTSINNIIEYSKQDEIMGILQAILDRQSAIEALSMILQPLSKSYQDLSEGLKSNPMADFADQFAGLCDRIDHNEELLEKIADRQGAIESLSMVLHPLSESCVNLAAKVEGDDALNGKVDALSLQVTALQAMVRNTYRKADQALAGQPKLELSDVDQATLKDFERPSEGSLEDSEEMPWYVPGNAQKSKKSKGKITVGAEEGQAEPSEPAD